MADKYLVTYNRNWFTLREYQLKNGNVISKPISVVGNQILISHSTYLLLKKFKAFDMKERGSLYVKVSIKIHEYGQTFGGSWIYNYLYNQCLSPISSNHAHGEV
jgi:hypothetical protein